MINIKNKDYRDILHLIYQADSCENTEGFIRSVLPEVARMFHCECVTFQLVGGCSGKIRILESRSFKAISHDLIEDGYFPGLYKDDFYRY